MSADAVSDWTADPETGRSNSSPLFTGLVEDVARMLREGGGHALSLGWVVGNARVIVARLAHVHHLIPAGVAGNAGVVELDPSAGEGPWLAWAKTAPWRFESYYKYHFTFACAGVLPESGPFAATVSVGGDSSDIYRYTVTESMTWDEILNGGDWDLTVRAGDDVIFSTDPYLMPKRPESEPQP